MAQVETLKWENGTLLLVDQTLLPNEVVYRSITTLQQARDAIYTMVVRGAPAIGVAAGYAMALQAKNGGEAQFPGGYRQAGEELKSARPTAVNLEWAVDRMVKRADALEGAPYAEKLAALEAEAVAIHQEDAAANRRLGEHLLSLLKDGDGVLTHCNAGALATSAYGTALSVFYLAQERGVKLHVFADETRPRLQGARLTSFELQNAGVDVTLICDNMAAVVMRQGKINAVITGCDRVAANGDTANKIGTFGVSILARHFGIPMYIAAPTSTIDMYCPTGVDIPVEERDSDEILRINGGLIAPADMKVYNPAFDVTPAENLTAIVTEKGIARPPYSQSLAQLMAHN